MGLDSVEILMKIEDTFGIKIPGREAEKIITVGDFHAAVWKHIAGKYSDKCKSQQLFYTLRKSFAHLFNFLPQHLHLNTSPQEIFPEKNRRQEYLNFAATTNLTLPDLVLTKAWSIILTTFGFAVIIGGLATSLILINVFEYSKWTLFIPAAGIIFTFLFSELLNPKRTVITETTMRAFTQHILALNFLALTVNEGTNRKEMETVINNIIADMSGLELREITAHKKIADDLGID